MALARVKTWVAGEVLTANDLNNEFNNILNNGGALVSPWPDATFDLNGNTIILDVDADTSMDAATDDQIDFTIAGADDVRMTANTFTLLSGTSFVLEQGSSIASAASISPTGFHEVTGTTTITSLGTLAAGAEVTLYFSGAGLNLIHNATSLILPYAIDYRTVQNELVTFTSLGSGNWILKSRSGPTDAPGTLKYGINTTAPTGFLICSAAEQNCTTYGGLFKEVVANQVDWGLGTGVTTISSVDTGTETITCAGAHGLVANDLMYFNNSGGALPAGLSAETAYYVISAGLTSTAFRVSATRGGSAVDLTDGGSGTNTIYNTFLLDFRGRMPLPADNMGGSSADRATDTQADNLGQAAGDEGGVGSHTHTDSGHSHPQRVFSSGTGTTMPETATGTTATTALNTASGTANLSTEGTATGNMPPYITVNMFVRF